MNVFYHTDKITSFIYHLYSLVKLSRSFSGIKTKADKFELLSLESRKFFACASHVSETSLTRLVLMPPYLITELGF